MFEKSLFRSVAVLAVLTLLMTAAQADLIPYTITVGDPGNAGELSGEGAGGAGPDRTCGAVDYVYDIGQHEVTNAEYTAFLNAVDPNGMNPHDLYNSEMGSGHGGISFNSGGAAGSKYSARDGRGNKPVDWVSFWDACRFANWLHNGQGGGDTETGAYTLTPDGIANNTVTRNAGWRWAVTSEDEWYKAAYYDGGSAVYYDYPTGSNTMPTGEAPPGTDDTNGSVNCLRSVHELTDVGAYTYKPSDSPYGTFDQGGNVWEWNESILVYDTVSNRLVRGYSFRVTLGHLQAAYRNISYTPDTEGDATGFRVVYIPEPGSFVLLLTGAVAGLIWWRRQDKQ